VASVDTIRGVAQGWFLALRFQRNHALTRAALKLRAGRPEPPIDRLATLLSEPVANASLHRIWFLSRGCRYDSKGSCTMCNYGRGASVPDEEVLQAVHAQVMAAKATGDDSILVSPSGSMFDLYEVSRDLRRSILAEAASSAAGEIICETRAETVDLESVQEFVGLVGPERASLECGLESSNPWVLEWSLNKQLDLARIATAIDTAHQAGAKIYLNVALGAPFLGARETVEDTLTTIRWAFKYGADATVIFPLHVREWTVTSWLWRHRYYQPPSLWALFETLQQLSAEEAAHTSFSWHRDYHASRDELASVMPVLASPTTCPECGSRILAILDDLRAGKQALMSQDQIPHCSCRDAWARAYGEPKADARRLAAGAYEALVTDLLGEEWWHTRHSELLQGLLRPASPREEPLSSTIDGSTAGI